jgi:putative chitinase
MKEERIWLNPYYYVQNNPVNRVDPTGALDDAPLKGTNPELYENDSDVIQSNSGSKLEKNPTVPDEPEPDKFKVSLSQLKEYFPKANSDVLKELEKNLNKHMRDFGIDNNLELAHFLSQAGHETGGFKKSSVTENLNYSVDGLLSTFSKYFVKEAPEEVSENDTVYVAGDYGRKEGQAAKQKEIADIVYGSRMGNEGEGYKYRGRGIFQLTGKNNYKLFSDFYQKNFDSSKDLLNTPNLIADNSEIALISALWFFEENVLKKININKNTTVENVTRKVNSGQNGIKDRKAIFSRIRKRQD